MNGPCDDFTSRDGEDQCDTCGRDWLEHDGPDDDEEDDR